MNFVLAVVAALRLATALPVASPAESLVAGEEKREVGIYDYYAPPRKDKDKREVGIYSYYATSKKDKEKRDVGIYSYYAPARKDKDKREGVEERSPQDFADDAPAKE